MQRSNARNLQQSLTVDWQVNCYECLNTKLKHGYRIRLRMISFLALPNLTNTCISVMPINKLLPSHRTNSLLTPSSFLLDVYCPTHLMTAAETRHQLEGFRHSISDNSKNASQYSSYEVHVNRKCIADIRGFGFAVFSLPRISRRDRKSLWRVRAIVT